MASNKTPSLDSIAKKAGLKITETSDHLTIKPYLGFRHKMNIGGPVLMVMGLALLIGINLKPHTGLGTKIGTSCLALLVVCMGVALIAIHATAFVTAGPGRLAYRHKFRSRSIATGPATRFTIRQETKVSRSSLSTQTYVYLITQIIVKQGDDQHCITEYWLNKNAETEITSMQLAHRLVASLKSKANMHSVKI